MRLRMPSVRRRFLSAPPGAFARSGSAIRRQHRRAPDFSALTEGPVLAYSVEELGYGPGIGEVPNASPQNSSVTLQARRFEARMRDPLKQWKLSPMDLESRRRWEAETRAKELCSTAPTRPSRRGGSSTRWTRRRDMYEPEVY